MNGSVNTNTYISVGMMAVLIAGFWTVMNAVYGAKSDLIARSDRYEMKVDALTARVDKFEANKETWSFQDMFKWAVHLQRDNPTLKIPEPEAGSR